MRLYHPEDTGRRAAAAARWGLAALAVVALHAGAGWWVLRHIGPATPPSLVQGVPIDLEPVAVPVKAPTLAARLAGGALPAPQTAAAAEPQPETPPDSPPAAAPPDAAPTPEPAPAPPEQQVAEAAPPEPPTAVAEPPPPEPTVEPPPPPQPTPETAQAAAPPDFQPAPEPPPPVALPQQETTSDAVLAPAPPSRPSLPDPRAVARETARRKAEAQRRAEQQAARAEARAKARADAQARADARDRAPPRPAGGPGPDNARTAPATSGADVANWRGAVIAHLNAYKPAFANGSGTARVTFSVDRSGRVLSASLAGSSGDASIDQAAVALVRRASPVPAPPPELGSRVNASVPIYFH